MPREIERVVITGAGVLACNGVGRRKFWESLRNGVSGIGPLDRFDASDLPCRIAGQIEDFEPGDYMDNADVRRWHRHVHLAVASTGLALTDSGMMGAGYDSERIAVGLGTSVGALDENYELYWNTFREHGLKRVSPVASSASSGHSLTAAVSARFGFRGPATTVGSGCSTGLDVLNWGRERIQRGLADAAIVGAVETPLSKPSFMATCALGVLSGRNEAPREAMRPFDRESDGLVLSEGAVVVALETASSARRRGAAIFGEVAGYGSAAEGLSPWRLDPEGRAVARAIEGALAASGTVPSEVDCAQCHGVSLPMYDRCETMGYKRALGSHAYRIPLSAAKSMIGQAYAAGGLFSVVSALLSLREGTIPPTINLCENDDQCDLDYVPHSARLNDVDTALVTALSFGGTHSAVVLKNLN